MARPGKQDQWDGLESAEVDMESEAGEGGRNYEMHWKGDMDGWRGEA